MLDIVYVAGTTAFFGVMLLYVRWCEALGRTDTESYPELSRSEAHGS